MAVDALRRLLRPLGPDEAETSRHGVPCDVARLLRAWLLGLAFAAGLLVGAWLG